MSDELDVLKIISERLEASRIPFMLTGSFALGYYGKPRMTRDPDFVVALLEQHVERLVEAFSADFYIDEDDARSAIKTRRMFNLMHLSSGIKIDLIVRKDSEYRQLEFARRRPVELAGVATWITSREDLILSKRVWARHADPIFRSATSNHCSTSRWIGYTSGSGLRNWASAPRWRRWQNERYVRQSGASRQ